MELFDYTYDDSDNEMTFNTLPIAKLKNVIIDCPSSFAFKAVKNDLDRLREEQFEESINITMKDTSTLEFTISNDNQLCALFTLQFNSKYPFEAPKMTFIGPQYDFPTNLDLTLNFKKFSQSEWSIRESISTIIMDILNVIFQKKIYFTTLSWREEEKVVIEFLKEMNYFSNPSYFDECQKTHEKGEGTGYGKSTDVNQSMIIEEKEKIKIQMFKKCFDIMTNDTELKLYINCLDIPSKLQVYLENSSFLHVNNIKDSVSPWVSFFQNETLTKSFHEKNSVKNFSMLENGPNIIVPETEIDNFFNSHYYCKEKPNTEALQKKLFKRIVIEMMDMDVLARQSDNFRFAWTPEKFQFCKFIVFSENEPYFGGMFEFHLYFPNNYPGSPPQIHLVTTGGNTVRFNPNLYEGGKVCLSLLGTWSGEQWNPNINCMTHVIQAISVMILSDQPVQNEPAYSSSMYFDSEDKQETSEILMVRKYKFQIKFYVLKYALLEHLKNHSSLFYPLFCQIFKTKRETILNSCEKYLQISQSPGFIKIKSAKGFQENKEAIFENPVFLETVIQEIKDLLQDD